MPRKLVRRRAFQTGENMNQRSLRDPVPAVREDEADGEIASLFADIRTHLGTSSVNLVWRHLATLPGALPWCWGAIVPLYRCGALASQARDFRSSLQGPVLPELPLEVREVFHLDAEDIDRIRATLRGYYASCTMNILSLNALRLFMNGSARATRAATGSPDPAGCPVEPTPIEAMARFPNPADVAPHVVDLAWRLNALGERGDGTILASLYRYLANWPSFLGVSWTLLVPLATDGQLETAISQCLAQADSRSGQLVDRLAAPVLEPDEPTRNAIRIAMDDFGRNAIAKVIPITRALLTAVGSGGGLGLPPVPSQG